MIVSCRTPLKNTLVMWVSWINIIINKEGYLNAIANFFIKVGSSERPLWLFIIPTGN